jgi:heptosyltransferase-3
MRNVNVGFVSYDSLGDSLIYLLMADNLRLNGLEITFYSNVAHQLKVWLPELTIKKLPDQELFETTLAQHDLAIVSPPVFLREKLTDDIVKKIREKWVLICHNAPNAWVYDHTERLKQILPAELMEQLVKLPSCGGAIRYKRFDKENVVDITLDFMANKMGLKYLSREISIAPPAHLNFRRNTKRIIVSPDSAWPEKKDWCSSAFIRLCRLLRKRGYQPIIVVAPQNHFIWTQLVNNEFEIPLFKNLGMLAEYVYESGLLIANDSGNGHLASMLGIPVVTIYRKSNQFFHWRPSWGKAVVVTPWMRLPFFNESLWRLFISPTRVLKHLKTIYED